MPHHGPPGPTTPSHAGWEKVPPRVSVAGMKLEMFGELRERHARCQHEVGDRNGTHTEKGAKITIVMAF